MGDAPKVPDAPLPRKGVRKVTSLTDVVEAAQKSPPKAEPIILEWYLPPTAEDPQGTLMEMTIQTRFPADPWAFGIRYMSDVMEEKRSQEPDAKGVMVHKHPEADVLALCREIVVEPKWLHNEAAVTRFKENVPPTTYAELRRKLMLGAGLDGDFFADYAVLTAPKAVLRASASAYANDSASLPGALMTDQQANSSPGPSMTSSDAEKPVESALATTSGSSPSTPTTAPPA